MIIDGLSEKTVNSLHIEGNVISKYAELHENYVGKINKNNIKIRKNIRKKLTLAFLLEPELALEIFDGINEGDYCFIYDDFAFLVRNNALIDIAFTGHHKDVINKIEWGKKQPENKPEIDLSKVQLSQHAIERFKERYKIYEGIELFKTEECALQLLSKATEEHAISEVGKVRRIIKNKFEEARYFIFKKWRFVILEQPDDTLLVKTIEWVYLH